MGEGICVERLVCLCVCYCVWIDWDGVVEGGNGRDYVCEEMGFACVFSETSMCMEGEIGVCLFRRRKE